MKEQNAYLYMATAKSYLFRRARETGEGGEGAGGKGERAGGACSFLCRLFCNAFFSQYKNRSCKRPRSFSFLYSGSMTR